MDPHGRRGMIPSMYLNRNRTLRSVLLLGAACLVFGAPVFATTLNVRDFGAVGDGETLDHEAINRAILAAVEAGGGTVWIPAGDYLSGSIRLQSNIRLHLDAGATIIAAPQEMNAYDYTEDFIPPAYQDGGHTYFRNSLIWGIGLENVSITGTGMIDGRGTWERGPGLWAWNWILDHMAGRAAEGPVPPPQLDEYGNPLPNSGLPPIRRGNKAIALKLCNNVLIRDVTIYRAGHFAILATGVDNMTIDNVTIDTNRDGINLDACRNVMVKNSRINAPLDDAISPKSSYALLEPRITENITIKNTMVSGFEVGTLIDGTMIPGRENRVGRIKFGTESSGGFRNITISNVVFKSSMGLMLLMVDGGIMENINISNVVMTDVHRYGIFIASGKRNRTPNLTTVSRMRNIDISNVIMDGVDHRIGMTITGMEEQPIENLRLSNIRLVSRGGGELWRARIQLPDPTTPAARYPKVGWAGVMPVYGIYARHVNGLELSRVSYSFLEPDMRPVAHFENIDGLILDRVRGQISEGIPPVVVTDDVRNVTVLDSPLFEDMMETAPNQIKE